MKILFTIIWMTICTQSLFSQTYTPIDTANLEIRKQESKLFLSNEKLFYKSLNSGYSFGERALIKRKYDSMDKAFNEDILNGQFIFDKRFDRMIDSILTELQATNPQIPKDLKFYISRNLPLNATSFGNKIFSINLGSFYFLQNDDQIAAVISHEIAHLILNHTIRNMQHQYMLNKSSDIRSEIFDIRNEKNNQGEKAYNKLRNILYEDGRLNKKQELEADSLGYVIYRKTKFNKGDYVKDLMLSEMYDTLRPAGLDIQTYKKVFNLPQLPFKEEWLKKEDFSNYNYSKFKDRYNEDSINSHPETVKRIALLKKTFPELMNTDSLHAATPQFLKLQQIAKYEQPPSLMIQEEYGLGVYICLLRIQENDKDEYYTEWLGKFFDKITDARKHYLLNRYLDRLDPKNQSESYQQFLNFMWNLNLKELEKITEHYTKKGS